MDEGELQRATSTSDVIAQRAQAASDSLSAPSNTSFALPPSTSSRNFGTSIAGAATTTKSASSTSSPSSSSSPLSTADIMGDETKQAASFPAPSTASPPLPSSPSSPSSTSTSASTSSSSSSSSSLTFPTSDSAVAIASGVSPPTRSHFEGVFSKTVIFADAKKGAKQYQEDSFFRWTSPSGRVTVGGIFDGHGGYNGHLASSAARDTAVLFLDANRFGCETWSVEDWSTRFHYLFMTMHKAIRERLLEDTTGPGSSMPLSAAGRTGGQTRGNGRTQDEKGIVRAAGGLPVHGGTTASVVAQIANADGSVTLIGANVGDSAAVCVNNSDGTFSFLTVDHGPENEEEYERVRSLPASEYPEKLLFVYDKSDVSRKYECPPVFTPQGVRDPVLAGSPWSHGLHPTNARYEPAVYAVTPRSVTRDATCIAMTRALGDFYAHQFGLTYEPSITVKKIPPNTHISVYIASDGVWDCWRYEDWARACVAVAKKSKPQQGTLTTGASLLAVSLQRAIASFGNQNYDDASLVCWQYPPEVAEQ